MLIFYNSAPTIHGVAKQKTIKEPVLTCMHPLKIKLRVGEFGTTYS